MPQRPGIVYFPEMSLTLVRRVTARLPPSHYLFRTHTAATKNEIKEYLRAVYGVKVERITTYISPGNVRRAPGKRALLYKLPDYKRVYVRVAEDAAADAAAQLK